MLRLISTIRKELLILLRDKGGLAIMFLMPIAMITIMALIQDAPFKDYQEMKIPLLLVNKDTGSLGKAIEKGLNESKMFEINKQTLNDTEVKQTVKKGDFEIGILIPENATQQLDQNVDLFVTKKLSEAGLGDSVVAENQNTEPLNLSIYFAPDTKKSFRISIINSLKQSTSKIETQTLLNFFSKELNKDGEQMNDKEQMKDFVQFNEISTVETPQEALQLNSVQHNVPAWTIFGIFFIVISMAGSIIKERDDGSYLRIRTMPGSFITVLSGKIISYLFITIIQAVLMLLVGLYLLPLLGLPKLSIGSNVLAMFLMIVFTGLAATGFGVMVGSIFKTHQQASTFGAVSVVILAALGGIWVPVYVMPEAVRIMSEFSPLYWSLSGFHKLFLNAGTLSDILPYLLKLSLFFFACLATAFYFDKQSQ
ncbi:MAG: ABC transporter permease [Bacteroidetes bacterium]|nr:ABC transporter permease [Bacteroidota bacterium]